ncbi:MAG: phosphorylase [Chloroflexi bacterium]|nr:phosphorylase [Chloroflexota bacterium]
MPESKQTFRPGTLWSAVVNRTRQAIEKGALRPIATERETVEDEGVAFDVRVVSALARKAHEANPDVRPPDFDPFLPYEEELFVANISKTHVGVLNKFPVVDNHLLIVTRAFEEQTSLLTPSDFQAFWACLQEFDGLAFYNSGQVSGASQRHKHLQVVPLPLFSDVPAIPIQPALENVIVTEGIGRSPMLPFNHAIARLDDLNGLSISAAATALLDHYDSMLRSLNMMGLPDNRRNYNMLATRRWMMLVPRSRERFHGMSVNALGFAGELLVMDRDQLETLRTHGPMAALKSVAI